MTTVAGCSAFFPNFSSLADPKSCVCLESGGSILAFYRLSVREKKAREKHEREKVHGHYGQNEKRKEIRKKSLMAAPG